MELQGLSVVFETRTSRVTGLLRLPKQGYRSRLTDYLNSPDQRFVPLTDARVEPLDGEGDVREFSFLLVAASEITVAWPGEPEPE